MKKRVKMIAPMEANFDQICRMPRDHKYVGDFSIMTDGYTFWLSQQKTGEAPAQNFEIPKKKFNRLLAWYLKPAKLRPEKR